jgi:serine/threonine protein kinase
MDIIDEYLKLPYLLRKQLAILQMNIGTDSNIKQKAMSLATNISVDINGYYRNVFDKVIYRLAIMKTYAIDQLLSKDFIGSIFCYRYNHTKEDVKSIIVLKSILKSGDHVRVIEGDLEGYPVIVKWYQSRKRDITYESSIYQRLRDMRCPLLPWFSTSYRFFEDPVLVIEKLKPLDHTDDEYQLGIQVLEQLRYIHQFGVHCDIKPHNIMKRIVGDKVLYFLIDHGGVSTDKLGYGYRRWLWSPAWTSQRSHVDNQITTYKNDLIELGYTMKGIQNLRLYHKRFGQYRRVDRYTGKLREYINCVMELDPKSQPSDNIYNRLIHILNR